MQIKIHESYRKVVAICDSELIGKKFEEGKMQLDIKESFFGGEEIEDDKVVEKLMKLSVDDATFNIVGEKAVGFAVEAGLISEESIGNVQGVPFALVL